MLLAYFTTDSMMAISNRLKKKRSSKNEAQRCSYSLILLLYLQICSFFCACDCMIFQLVDLQMQVFITYYIQSNDQLYGFNLLFFCRSYSW